MYSQTYATDTNKLGANKESMNTNTCYRHIKRATQATRDYQGKPLEESVERERGSRMKKMTDKRKYFIFTKLHG